MEHLLILKQMEDILNKELYITQSDYLKLFPEGTPREQALLPIFQLEQQGVLMCNRERSEPVYYIGGTVHH